MEALSRVDVLPALLSVTERDTLRAHEQTIERGLQTFYEVGNALAAIRDGGLYRTGHKTFEEYCQDRWGMTRRHADRLIVSSEIVDNLGPIGPSLPTAESQVRALTRLDPEQQREVWQRAVETSTNGLPTASHVARLVDEYRAPEPTPMAVHYSSATPEWYTPAHIIDLVLEFFDEIDLDPCSNSHETPNVPAATRYVEADDGLKQPWFGRVYMNPPYGDLISGWVKKLHDEYQNGDVEAAIALVPLRGDTAWWFDYVMPYAMCFIRGRLRFVGAENSAPFPSVLVYYGDEIERFKETTAPLGYVLTVHGHKAGDRLLEDQE